MKITSIQKVIKVGDSAGVTIPARDLKESDIAVGDNVKITVEQVAKTSPKTKLDEEYDQFVKQYSKTLKNLSKR